ncbi:MAG: hypothetical protein ACTSU5_14570 [Promethearchaeota archaeon]
MAVLLGSVVFGAILIASAPHPGVGGSISTPTASGGPGTYFGSNGYSQGMYWEYNYTKIAPNATSTYGTDPADEGNRTLFEVTDVVNMDMTSHSQPPDMVYTGYYDVLLGFVYETNESGWYGLHPNHKGDKSEAQVLGARNATDYHGDWMWWSFYGYQADFSGGFLDKQVDKGPLADYEVRFHGSDWVYLEDADGTGDHIDINLTSDTLALEHFTHWNGTSVALQVDLIRSGKAGQMAYNLPVGSIVEWEIKEGSDNEHLTIPTELEGNHTRLKVTNVSRWQNESGVWYEHANFTQAITNASDGWVLGDNPHQVENVVSNSSFSEPVDVFNAFQKIEYLIPVNKSKNDVDMAWFNRTLYNFVALMGWADNYTLTDYDQSQRLLHWMDDQGLDYWLYYNERGILTNYTVLDGPTTEVQVLLNQTFIGRQDFYGTSRTSFCYKINVAPYGEKEPNVNDISKTVVWNYNAGETGVKVPHGGWEEDSSVLLWSNVTRDLYNETSYMLAPYKPSYQPSSSGDQKLGLGFHDILSLIVTDGPMFLLPCRRDGGTTVPDSAWFGGALEILFNRMAADPNHQLPVTGDKTYTVNDTDPDIVEFKVHNSSGAYALLRFSKADGVLQDYFEHNNTELTYHQQLIDCTQPTMAWGIHTDDFIRVQVDEFNAGNEYLFPADQMEGMETGGVIEVTIGDLVGAGCYAIKPGEASCSEYDLAFKATVRTANRDDTTVWDTVLSNDYLEGASVLDHVFDFGGGPGPLVMPVWSGQGLAKDWLEDTFQSTSGANWKPGDLFDSWGWDGNTFRATNSSNDAEYFVKVNATNGLFEKVVIKNAAGDVFLNLTRIYYLPAIPLGVPGSWDPPDAAKIVQLTQQGLYTTFTLLSQDTGMDLQLSLSASKPVSITMALWSQNPSSETTELLDESGNEVAVFFAIEANDTSAINYPVEVRISLPPNLPGMSETELARSMELLVWDNGFDDWYSDNVEISVDLTSNTAYLRIYHLSAFALGYRAERQDHGFDVPGFQPLYLLVSLLGATFLLSRKRTKT